MAMKPSDDSGETCSLPEGRFQGPKAFADLVRQALECAATERWSHLMLSDPDFSDWPLGERSVVASLNAWAGPGRRIQFLAQDFGSLRERHPRLVQWRVTWSHLVEAHALRRRTGDELPSAIWTPGWTLERVDLDRCIVVTSRSPERRVALQERLHACWQQGSPSFPATTLGL
jgi:hypothetical protein